LAIIGLLATAYAKGPDREVSIDSATMGKNCHIDYDVVNLESGKKHTLHWTSETGQDTFDIQFDPTIGTPCLDNHGTKVSTFHVVKNHDSDKCYVDPNATQYKVFKYSITVLGEHQPCNDPAVIVQDGKATNSIYIIERGKKEKATEKK
jgi:hypothetical protein